MITVVSIIVVPYDHSESSKKALAKAASLAQADERIELNIITVVEPNSPEAYSDLLSVKEIREDLLAEARKHLDEAKSNLSSLPNTIKTAVLLGTPSLSIVEYAIQKDAELIIMGSRGLTELKELFLGSVSHYVSQKSPCPVYIVK
ncbi:universal stress protein [Metabacillus sp. KIGAM252]|uniref:Universal stress protein n=1 Tax=Metabacillus flavus TaxID=2823519 RepID=A0ABS5LCJ8_9BACI|nr:universal stress protein [Metabacillus flavus]MBS2968460.1 universal stress protein [Metabacillus flavus]